MSDAGAHEIAAREPADREARVVAGIDREEREPAMGAAVEPDEILIVRRGPGANCSSIGSALDVLFMTAALAGAILVGVAAALEERAPASKKDPPDREETDARAG